MRQTKFRAWQKQPSLYRSEGMHEVTSLVFYPEYGGGEAFMKNTENDDEGSEFFEDIVLMQFTGVYDKANKPVWEGDIVMVVGEPKHGYVAYQDEAGAFLVDYWQEGDRKSKGDLLANIEADDLKVIGNIHANPEMLRKASKYAALG